MKTPNYSVRFLYVVTVAFALFLTGTAHCALYQLEDSGWSVAVNEDWDIGVTVDAVTDDAVIIQIQKRFVGEPDEFGLMPAMYAEFIKDSETALNKIVITDEFITNDTTVDWIDFHIELAVSIFDPEAGFCTQCIPSGDQFSLVAIGNPAGYNGLPTKIDFAGGLVPNDPPDQDDFRPGYHSGSMTIIVDPEMEVGQRILLKEYPTIPEPATFALLLMAGLMILARRK